MPFGRDIKKLREQANISVEKLALKIGVKASRWRKWEEKDLSPRLDDAQRIEAFFGMPLDDVTKLSSISKFLIVPQETETLPNGDPTPLGEGWQKIVAMNIPLDDKITLLCDKIGMLNVERGILLQKAELLEQLSNIRLEKINELKEENEKLKKGAKA